MWLGRAIYITTRIWVALSVILVCLFNSGTAHATMLLDNGQQATSYSYGVSGKDSLPDKVEWKLFQPFKITDPAWQIETIGVAGCQSEGIQESSIIGALVPDLGGRPDEGNPIQHATYSLTPCIVGKEWKDESFGVGLLQGRYWMIFSAATEDGRSSISFGEYGEGGFSRRGYDGAEFTHGPCAIRITGEVVPEPGTIFLLGLGGFGLLRRQKSDNR